NGIRDRSRRELRVDSGVRGTQHASRRGTPWGVKPVDNGLTSASHTADERATPAIYADVKEPAQASLEKTGVSGCHTWPKMGRRGLRVGLSKRKPTDAERKADDGLLRLVHLSVGPGESALPKSTGPTGKRSARKRACSVWSGGKAAKPYLSLPYTRLSHVP